MAHGGRESIGGTFHLGTRRTSRYLRSAGGTGLRPRLAGLLCDVGQPEVSARLTRLMGSTERLTIEVIGLKHAADLNQALCDERVGRYIGGPDVTTLEALQDRITLLSTGPPDDRDELWLNFAVLCAGSVIGRIEATLHSGVAEIGYVFGPAWWGHGYASEAVSWLLPHLAERGVSVVWATVTPGNEASLRLLERLGFVSTQPPTHLRLLPYDDGDLALSRHCTSAA